MTREEFAAQFEKFYRLTYARAVRRIEDKRHRMSPESVALLTHLCTTGPLSLTELARHTGRAQSTMSEMVDHLVQKELLERDRDPEDARRILIWLTPAGQDTLSQSLSVLDQGRLGAAAGALSGDERSAFTNLFEKLTSALLLKDDQS